MRGCPINTGEAESGKNGTVVPKGIRQVFCIAHAVLQSQQAGMIANQWPDQIGQSGIGSCFARDDNPVTNTDGFGAGVGMQSVYWFASTFFAMMDQPESILLNGIVRTTKMKMYFLPGQGKQASVISTDCTGTNQSNFANHRAFHMN